MIFRRWHEMSGIGKDHLVADIVIIGNGIAGNSAASVIHNFSPGYKIIMISEESEPVYSPCVFGAYIAGEIDKDRVYLKSLGHYQEEGITPIFGEKVLKIDTLKKYVILQQTTISYSKLIIATGSKAIVPKIDGVSKEGVFTLKKMSDADAIISYPGRKVVVVGSGPIGIEASLALYEKGWDVTIIESLPWIIPKVFDKKVSEIVKNIMKEKGFKIYTGEKVTSIYGSNCVEGVSTDKLSIDCQMVILAVGMKPRVSLAEKCGIKLGRLGGIIVNEQMMTSEDDIYACGDCVETKDLLTDSYNLNLLWHNARRQGDVAGSNCVGKSRFYSGSTSQIALNIFGTFAGGLGLNTEAFDYGIKELIECKLSRSSIWLVSVNEVLEGVQFIGDIQDTGMLLPLMRSRKKIKDFALLNTAASWTLKGYTSVSG